MLNKHKNLHLIIKTAKYWWATYW